MQLSDEQRTAIEQRIRELEQQRLAHLASVNACEGAIMALRELLATPQE